MEHCNLTIEEAAQIFNKLGGMEGVQRFLSNSNLSVVIANGAKVLTSSDRYLYDDIKSFDHQLEYYNCGVSDAVKDIIIKSTSVISTKVKDFLVISTSVKSLGFKFGANYNEICLKARALGLRLLPNEFSFSLALTILQQRVSGFGPNWQYFAMKPINGSSHYFSFNGETETIRTVWDDCDGESTQVIPRDATFHFRLDKQVILLL